MDFKWKLSRPGIELEFETGSISEAIGMLGEEGTQISTVFGFTMGARAAEVQQTSEAAAEPAKRGRGPNKPKPEAIAPPPMPVPPIAPVLPDATTVLPPNELNAASALALPADGGIPPFLARTAPSIVPPPPPSPTPPPVGVLGPKVVHSLDNLRKGNVATDPTGQQLSDWLAAAGLTIKGASYDDACRTVLMTSDEKLHEIAQALGA